MHQHRTIPADDGEQCLLAEHVLQLEKVRTGNVADAVVGDSAHIHNGNTSIEERFRLLHTHSRRTRNRQGRFGRRRPMLRQSGQPQPITQPFTVGGVLKRPQIHLFQRVGSCQEGVDTHENVSRRRSRPILLPAAAQRIQPRNHRYRVIGPSQVAIRGRENDEDPIITGIEPHGGLERFGCRIKGASAELGEPNHRRYSLG